MAVRIRMTKRGRKHRPYFRIVAIESRNPRDGKYLEDLGSYDPMVRDKEARLSLKAQRIKHWLSVGAKPTPKVALILKKHLERFAKIESGEIVPQPTTAAQENEESTPAETSDATDVNDGDSGDT